MEKYLTYRLANGLRIIHYEVPNRVAHLALMINVGSRDEAEPEQGLAHFIEHSIFKGTKKRKAYHIFARIEDVGGDLNAYTAKEETCVHAAFLSEYYERIIELFSDIVFNSTFPEQEIEKEKDVIIDEINSYNDSPAELIFDEFEEHLFKNHAIGRNILGTIKTLKSFRKKHIHSFQEHYYNPAEMVISSIGSISFEKLIKLSYKYFSNYSNSGSNAERIAFSDYQPFNINSKKDTFQAHCIIGNIAYDYMHENRTGLLLLNNLLGGTGMKSRLNMTLREKYGIAYNVESVYSPYSDTGFFCIYFGTDAKNISKCHEIIFKELTLLRNKKLGSNQLSVAKKQLNGLIAIASENYASHLLGIAKSYMVYNKVDTMEELYQKIEKITAVQLLEIANEIFDSNIMSFLTFD